MESIGVIMSVWILAVGVLASGEASSALKCPPCDEASSGRRLQCGAAPSCANGWVPDLCKCCWTCAKGREQFCGGLWHMHGRCEQGLRCEMETQQLERVVRNGRPGGEELNPYLLPNGRCKGKDGGTPCERANCPTGTKCHHSYSHCGEFPDTYSLSHCVPVPKCIQGDVDCQHTLFFGCDVVDGQCWCGEKTACNGQPPFSFPTRHSCGHLLAPTSSAGAGPGTTSPPEHDRATRPRIQISGNRPLNIGILEGILLSNVKSEEGTSCRLDNGSVVAEGTTWSVSQCSTCNCSTGLIACDEVWGLNCPALLPSCRKRTLSFDRCCAVCQDNSEELEVVDEIEIAVEDVVGEEGKSSPTPEHPKDSDVKHGGKMISKHLVWPVLMGCVGFALLLIVLAIVGRRYSLQHNQEPRGSLAYTPATVEQQHLHALLQCKTTY